MKNQKRLKRIRKKNEARSRAASQEIAPLKEHLIGCRMERVFSTPSLDELLTAPKMAQAEEFGRAIAEMAANAALEKGLLAGAQRRAGNVTR